MTMLRRTLEIRIVLVWRWLGWIVIVLEHADLVRVLFTSVRERDDKKLPGHAQTPEFRYAGEFRRVANGRGGRGSRDWWNAHYLEIDLRPCTKCGTAHESILLGKSSAPVNGRSQVPSVAAKARNRMFWLSIRARCGSGG
jgi:hypothetical protein